MKKRTLVCFLIFTLCVFHFSITDTVLGQDTSPEELAQQVFDEHNLVLRRANIKQYLPGLLEGLKGELPLGLTPAGVIELALNSVKSDPTGEQLKATARLAGLELTDEHIAILKDADVQKVLNDDTTKALLSLAGNDLTAGLDKFLELINASEAIQPGDGQQPGDGDGQQPDPAPPTLSITTPIPTTERIGSFSIAYNTADVNNDPVTVTESISVEPAEAAGYYRSTVIGSRVQVTQTSPTADMPTIPGATVTLTLVANDGTADSAPATFVINFATSEWKQPSEPPSTGDLSPVNLIPNPLNPHAKLGEGRSKLGGLSLNRIQLRKSIEQLIADRGLPLSDDAYDQAIDRVFDAVFMGTQGLLPVRQIKQTLKSRHSFSVFQTEAAQLDHENFGNAITPILTELLYQGNSEVPWGSPDKYLASDSMNVYVRVPDTLEGGSVEFRRNNSDVYPGTRISPTAFQADTIPYTFKLEETLAATNLPAWPDSGLQIFSEVVLRFSQEGLEGNYISLQMVEHHEDKGVVWKRDDVGIIPGRNVYYYFEVTLKEPVYLDIIDPIALGEAIVSPDGKHTQEDQDPIPITHWVMPDPRNLQFQDRGIIAELFTDEVNLEILNVYNQINQGDRVNYNKLIRLLGNSAGDLYTKFQEDFDPRLASVFTVPKIDYDTESLWVAPIPKIAEGQNTFEVVIRNAVGADVDHIVVDFIADSSAPEASVRFDNANEDTSEGYWSMVDPSDPTFVTTNKMGGPASLLDISSVLTKGILGRDDGYLLYQFIGLDADGNPKTDADGNPITTWLPLTVESSMLASDLWDIATEQLQNNPTVKSALDLPLSGVKILLPDLLEISPGLSEYIDANPTATIRSIFDARYDTVLSFITPPLIQQELGINPVILPLLGINNRINIVDSGEDGLSKAKFIHALFGAIAADIDPIPLTYDENRSMRLPFLPGDYGIRALGIDNLLNVSSHIPPTRLRIVKPEYDSSSITLASLGDINFNGKVDDYEKNVIYANARELTLTISVDQRSGAENHGIAHPGTITVQYKNADGDWVTIGEPIDLVEAGHPAGTTFPHPWTVTDFDDLISADNSVELRTITANALDLTMTTPKEKYFTVQLDADVHPVDPKVLIVDLPVDPEMGVVMNDGTPVTTNPDSGAPQGTIELIAYTPRRTVPATASILVEAKRMNDNDDAWKDIGTVELPTDPAGMSGTDTAAITFNGNALKDVYVKDTLHIQDSGSYLKWVITVDTEALALADTIDMNDLAAAHAASNPDAKPLSELDKNRYMVRAYVVGNDKKKILDSVAEGKNYTDMFSLDNVDDVAPLGQNMIAVTQPGVEVTVNADGSFGVGGLVDKYDPDVHSPIITLTITPGAKRDTYDSVHLFTSLPEGAILGDVTEDPVGSGVFKVTVDVGTLMDADEHVHNDRYLEDWAIQNPNEFVYNPKGEFFSFTVYALTEDKTGNRQDKDKIYIADDLNNPVKAHEITVNVKNEYRHDPGVLAITVENSDGMVNPDSRAPKYELTFNAYTYGDTSPSSPPTEAVRFEVKRPGDDTWERIIGTVESEMVAAADLDDITTGLIQITQQNILSGGDSTLAIPVLMKYSVTVDTREFALLDRMDEMDEPIKLKDTINRGDAAQRHIYDKEDDNKYRVRAIALTPKNLDHPEYPQIDGVEAHFSLDNVDDVPPLGPTKITGVSDRDEYGDMQPILPDPDDGSYTVGGIVDPLQRVKSPVAIFHIQPEAEEITYLGGSFVLVQTADGKEIRYAEGSLALEADGNLKDGYVQVDDGTLNNGYVEIDVGALPNGTYMYHALTVDEHGNEQVQGEDDKPSPIYTAHVRNFNVDHISNKMVTAVDGEEGEEGVNRLPLHKTVGELPGRYPLNESIAVSFDVHEDSFLEKGDLTGLLVHGPDVKDVKSAPPEGEGDAFSVMATNLSELSKTSGDGWYTLHARVTKRNGSITFPLATINLDNTGPMIVIETPTKGHTVSDLPTLLAKFRDGALGSGVSDGSGVSETDTAEVSLARLRPKEVGHDEVSIPVNPAMVEQGLDPVGPDNPERTGSVVYTRTDSLAGGAYQFTVTVKDRLGNVGEETVIFAVEGTDPIVVITPSAAGQVYDISQPVIKGQYAVASDSDTDKTKLSFTLNGEMIKEDDENLILDKENSTFEYTLPKKSVDHVVGLDDGEYTFVATVTDENGKTTQATTVFSVKLPVPTVVIHTPHAGQVYDHGKPIIIGEVSGADTIKVKLSIGSGDDMSVNVDANNQFTYTPSVDLGHGPHTVKVVVTDGNDRTAETSADFKVDIPGPTVSIDYPIAGATYDHTYRKISGAFTGVGKVDVKITVDGGDMDAITNEDKLDGNNVTEFSYDLSEKLPEGEYTVSVEITDANEKTAKTTSVFSVVYPEASVSIDYPVAGVTYDHEYRDVLGVFTGVGDVKVELRVDNAPVEVMVKDNKFTYKRENKLPEGEHTISVSVTDDNGEVAQASTTFSVVYPEASVSIDYPVAGVTYDHEYRDVLGVFTGVGDVKVELRVDNVPVEVMVKDNKFTYKRENKLPEGEHTISVSVTDDNGEVAQASTTFSVVYPEASVMIYSPVAGDTYDHEYRKIIGVFTGVGDVNVSIMLNDRLVDKDSISVEENEFTYMLSDKLAEGDHMVSVSVEDANGETAQATSIFSVVYPEASVSIDYPVAGVTYDHEYRDVLGVFTGVGDVKVELRVDNAPVEVMVEDNKFTYKRENKLPEGEHTISVSVTDDNGEVAQASTTFSVVYPEASVMIYSPVAGDTYDHEYRKIIGVFTGVGDVNVSIMLNDRLVDKDSISVEENEFTYMLSDKLAEGDHMVSVSVEDANGETAQATSIFSVVYPEASVSIDYPVAGVTYDHEYRDVLGVFTGVGDVKVELRVDNAPVEVMVEDNKFTYKRENKLPEGEHTISVSVTDDNGEVAQASTTFSVVYPEASVMIYSPVAGDTYDHEYRKIIGVFTGVGDVNVSIMLNDRLVDKDSISVEENEFTYMLSDKLAEGDHMVSVSVEDANGETAQATSIFSVVYPEASVSIDYPVAGVTYDHEYRDVLGVFTGVGDVKVELRVDNAPVEVMVEDNKFTYKRENKLPEGEHTISVSVTDDNGEVAQASTTFSVVYPEASVAILSPASGQTYDHGEPVIRVEYSGVVGVDVTTLTVNGVDVEGVDTEENAFEFTPSPILDAGEHTVFVEVTDANEKTAKATVVFNTISDTTPPVISEVSPSGLLRLSATDVINGQYGVTISAIITDEQSDIIRIEYAISEGALRPKSDDEQYQAYPIDRADGKFEVSESFDLGTHQVSLRVESEGGVREFRWHFTLEADTAAPTITSITPSGTIHAERPSISASAADNSAVAEMTIVVKDSVGAEVAGEATFDLQTNDAGDIIDDDNNVIRRDHGVTRVDFHPEAPLSEGTYTIEVRATDTYNNSSTATGVFTVDFDTAAPIITSYSPQNDARLIYKHNEVAKPTISITYGDSETGVNVDSVRLSIHSPSVDQVINLTQEQKEAYSPSEGFKSASQVIYSPSEGFTEPGQYTVILEVSDNANLQRKISEESDGARDWLANHTVHKFSFFVEYTDAPVLMAPFNYPNPFAENTRISFGLNQMSVVSIVIYDSTLRPVRVLLDNKLMPAGKHTGGNGIGWDGKTSSGESLARGIYYAQIVVTGGFEAEYAILKLALTGAK